MIAPIIRPHLRLVAWAGARDGRRTGISLAAPLLVKIAIDHGIQGRHVHTVDVVALVYLVLVIVRPVAERAIVLCSARAGERFLGDLRISGVRQAAGAVAAVLRGDARRRARLAAHRGRPDAHDVHAPGARRGRRLACCSSS